MRTTAVFAAALLAAVASLTACSSGSPAPTPTVTITAKATQAAAPETAAATDQQIASIEACAKALHEQAFSDDDTLPTECYGIGEDGYAEAHNLAVDLNINDLNARAASEAAKDGQ